MAAHLVYRGFTIEKITPYRSPGEPPYYSVTKAGKVVSSGHPTDEAAMIWIDAFKRRQLEAGRK